MPPKMKNKTQDSAEIRLSVNNLEDGNWTVFNHIDDANNDVMMQDVENNIIENPTSDVMRHIRSNLGRYSEGRTFTKAENKAYAEENAAQVSAIAQRSNYYSKKDRKDYLNKSDEQYKKAAKKMKELEAVQRKHDSVKENKLKLEILSLQCEAKKNHVRAYSTNKEEEEYQLKMADYWLLCRMEDLVSENKDENYDRQHSTIESGKLEIHQKLRGNKAFVNYRKRVLTRIKNENPDVTLEELERLTKEEIGEDNSAVFRKEDYLTVLQKENDETRAIENIINKLRVYKDSLGGSPNFPDSDPTLPEELVMAGNHGVENRRAFARKMLRGNFFQNIYGRMLTWKYGQDQPLSQYEIAFQYLESLKRLAMYKDIIQGEYQKDKEKQIRDIKLLPGGGKNMNLSKIYGKYTAGHDMLFALTRMSCHNNLNGAAIESDHCDEILKSIVILVRKLETSDNPDALLNYFRQLDGSCFDDRLRNVQEYAERNDIVLYDEVVVDNYKMDEGGSDDIPEPEDHSLYIKKKSEVNKMELNGEMDLVTAISKVIEALLVSNGMDPNVETPEWSTVKPELLRQLVGKNFFKNTEDGAKGTDSIETKEQDINDMESFMRDIMGVIA